MIWLGKARNKKRWTAFLKETYSDDDSPISEFAVSQGESFYDHDFLESMFDAKWRTLDDALKTLSASSSHAEELRKKVNPFDANFAILCFSDDFSNPANFETEGLRLVYIGQFAFDPSARPEGAPDHEVYLKLVGATLEFEGTTTQSVKLDERGLMIGRTNPYARMLDITPLVPEAADNQVRASVNSEGLWELRDFGENGLTVVAGQNFDGARWLPIPGSQFRVGSLVFEWSDEP